MSLWHEESNSELRDLFFESAAELLQALNEDGLELEKKPEDAEIVRRIRRTVHTLKGDSAAAGFQELSTLAHALEDALDAGVASEQAARLAELVLRTADQFAAMLAAYRESKTPTVPDDLVAAIRALAGSTEVENLRYEGPQTPSHAWTEYEQVLINSALEKGERVFQITVSVDHTCPAAVALQMLRNALQPAGAILAMHPEEPDVLLDSAKFALSTKRGEKWLRSRCLVPGVTTAVTIEAIAAKLAAGPQPVPPSSPATDFKADPAQAEEPDAKSSVSSESADSEPRLQSSQSTLRVDSARIDAALNLLGELILGKSMLTQNVNEFNKRFVRDPLRAKFEDSLGFLGRTLGDLQKSLMKIRMVPVEQLLRRFPRIVRDLSRTCGKEAQLEIDAANTDLDKSILDLLAEPLSHMVRNAIDHGIEPPEERVAKGKPRAGKVSLKAFHQGNHVVIECSDDGHGINRDRLIQRAIDSGVCSQQEIARMTESEVLTLVFHPGLSTAASVTAISGRGVGMDVVKTVVGRLKGTVHVESQLGHGTTIRLKVPLTVAIIKALMFRVGERLYAVPLTSVVEITRAKPSDIRAVDQHEVLQLRGEILTVVRLERLNRRPGPEPARFFVVVISHGERKIGMIVDSLVGEEELVIKALDDQLVATEFVSGASILGDGSVVLILNLQSVVAKLSRKSDAITLGASA